MLFPLSETSFFRLDLLSEALAELLLFLLEFGIVDLLDLWLPKLPGLHLLLSVVLVVELLGRRDQVQHMRPDEKRAQLAEIAVVLVLDLGNTPKVLTTFDDAPIGGLDVLSRTNNGERHGVGEHTSMLCSGLVVIFDGRLVNTDSLGGDNLPNTLLEDEKVVLSEGVGFGDDGDEIDTRAETLHDLNVERLQTLKSNVNQSACYCICH